MNGREASYDKEVDILSEECSSRHANGGKGENYGQSTLQICPIETLKV